MRGNHNLAFAFERFNNPQLNHVSNGALIHVETHGGFTVVMASAQFRDQVRAIMAAIVRNDSWQLP